MAGTNVHKQAANDKTNEKKSLEQLNNAVFSRMTVFILGDALSIQKDNASTPFLYLRRIIRLDKLGQAFLVRLTMRL